MSFNAFFSKFNHWVILFVCFLYFLIAFLTLYFVYEEVKDKNKYSNGINEDFIIFNSIILIIISAMIIAFIAFGIFKERNRIIDLCIVLLLLIGLIITIINLVFFVNIIKDDAYDKKKDVNFFLKADTHVYLNVIGVSFSLMFVVIKIYTIILKSDDIY